MSRDRAGPYLGGLTRLVWQWVRQQIYAEVVARGYDDLNPAHMSVFRTQTADGLRPTELAEEMQITKQSVDESLGHLERKGYLVREPDPTDNRGRRIRLTEQGRQLESVVWEAAAKAERDAAELIGQERMDDLHQALADLVSLIRRPDDERP